jgi:acyl carrier protein
VIVHGWSVSAVRPARSDPDAFRSCQRLGFYSLLYLAQALAGRDECAEVRLLLLSTHLHDVTGREELAAERAPLLGLARVLPQEHSRLGCASVDLELDDPIGPERLVEQLIGEVASGCRDAVVALRGGHRWVPSFEPEPLERPGERLWPIRPGGVYLITGGTGRIGRALTDFFVARAEARVGLIGRSGPPDDPAWRRWLDERHGRVAVEAADVADPEQLAGAVARLSARLGAPNGLVHAAGLTAPAAFEPIARTDPATCERHFAAKAHGLYALDGVLSGRELDFCLALSSLSTVVGGVGFGAYAAANHFVDAWVQRQHRAGSSPWTSVDLEGWRTDRPVGAAHPRSVGDFALSAEEGIDCLRRVLAAGPLPRVVVSTGDLPTRAQRRGADRSPPAGSDEEPSPPDRRPDPATSRYAAPRGPREEAIAGIWRELLGADRVGRHDDFFDLHGHSLLAIQVVSRIRDSLGVDLPIRSLFDGPTVAELAAAVDAARAAPSEERADLRELLDELDQLSDAEVERLLEAAEGSGG